MMNGRKGNKTMRCSLCGGILKYDNGLYVCENCGNRQSIENFFENIQVFICYTEEDEQGRRSKDSIIAQELYNKLSAANINTFYQRTSAGGLFGEDYDRAYEIALNHAEIVVMLGTRNEYFTKLQTSVCDKIKDKTIIPVFSDMPAQDLPEELSALQAINYENIGADVDLVNRILKLLGRENDVEIYKRQKKSKSTKYITFGIITALLSAAAVYIVFGTPYVLKSKKYAYAEKLVEEQRYTSAIEVLNDIIEYNNSDNLLNDIYNKYDGYYYNEDQSIGLHLNTNNNKKSEIEIEISNDDEVIILNSSSSIVKNEVNFTFNNSVKSGNGIISLSDNGLNLYIHINTDNQDYKQFFDLQNKSDAPVAKAITKDTIIKWLSKRTTKSDILLQGYKLKQANGIYYIENTDIKLMFMEQDLYALGEKFGGQGTPETSDISDEYLYTVSAPANILMPDSVEKPASSTIVDDIIYCPFADVQSPQNSDIICPYREEENTGNRILRNDSVVFASSKAVLGKYYWKCLCEYEIYPNVEIVRDNKDSFIAYKIAFPYPDGSSNKYSPGKYIMYSIDKKSLKATEIKEQEYLTDPDNTILREFLGEYADDSYRVRF